MAATILNRTPLASISFKDGNGDHIRVYYQDEAGNIRETFYDDGNGWALREKDIVGVGRLNTGIAATVWNNGTQIRVYFFNQSGQLVERCYEGGGAGSWVDGYLSRSNIVGADTSSVAVIAQHAPGPHLEVFYQGKDGSLYVATNSSETSWSSTKLQVPPVPYGSGIAATLLANNTSRRLYTANAQNQIIEVTSEDGKSWKIDRAIASGTNHQIGAGIACTVLGSQINVQVVTLDNQLVFYRWTGTWSGPIAIATTISFSAVSCFTLNSRINTYFQRQGQHITEYRSNTSGDNFQPDKTDVPVRR